MIDVTVRVKSPTAARLLAGLLRQAAADEADRGQARHWRGAARRLDECVRLPRYAPRVRRPQAAEIDHSAVRRVVTGAHPLPVLTRDEARLACWHLMVNGCSITESAERLGVRPRTVSRWRAEDLGGCS
ncbi:hypothetical protein CQW39_09505 [Streptomyces griseofuscus]|uniref:hypothetical protein n=1 Tax=Streptomyces griseofuscus TaxID=146922 RepID=UPI000F6474CC|nr:hypothetical protein [Streptomyces griseofuscus]RRQ79374.1 hypothetical protein CQW39_09505 [Streptomyces griseofuscus]